MVRDLYNPLETQGQLATLKRINQMMEIVFQYAIKNGYMAEDKNPLIAVNYSKNYKKYENSAATHYPKLVSLDDLRDFFRNLAEQDESKITYSVATIFCAITGLRVESVVTARWSYFSQDFSTLIYPKSKLKGELSTEGRREDLILPIPPILQQILQKYKTTTNPFAAFRRTEYVFSGIRGAIKSDGLRKFVKEVSNYKITPHGLRGTLTTWSKKRLEHQVPPLLRENVSPPKANDRRNRKSLHGHKLYRPRGSRTLIEAREVVLGIFKRAI